MKKIAVTLLALVIVLTTVLVPILANEETITTVGYSAARVNKVNLTDVKNIKEYDEGTFEWAYKITDAEGLVALSEIVNGGNSLKKIYIYLAKDIDMSSVENFTPIGVRKFTINSMVTAATKPGDGTMGGVTSATFLDDESVPFEGQFNGHGHVITNLKVTIDGEEALYAGLFGYVKNATITNVIIGEGSAIESSYNGSGGCAGLVGFATGVTVIDNCMNMAPVCAGAQAKLEVDQNYNFAVHAAGILGRGGAQIKNCTNTANMEGVKSAGGIMGYKEGDSSITNCRNTGDIIGDKAGGICSRPNTIDGCINNGDVQGRDWAGGIVGGDSNPTIRNSKNYGTITAIDGGVEDAPADGSNVHQIFPRTGTLENNEELAGQTDPTLATDIPTITPDYNAEDTDGTETAYTTYETQVQTQKVEIPVNSSPTGDEIGYSSARVVKVDLSEVPDIMTYWDLDEEAPAYKITDIEGWFYMDELLYDFIVFTDITIYLATDLDFSSVTDMRAISYDTENWTATIPAPDYFFGGILDGQGYQICNANINETWGGNLIDTNGNAVNNRAAAAGLFAIVQDATLRNIVIDDSCSFKLTSTASYPIAGALTAHARGSVVIDNCWNKATVSGARQAGGLIGRTNTSTDTTIKNSTNSGNVTAAYNAGGLAGYLDTGKTNAADVMKPESIVIDNCRNVGKITNTSVLTDAGYATGGFVSRTWSPTLISNSINNGDVFGTSNVGAFIGTTKRAVRLNNCQNFALLSEDAPLGNVGLVARVDVVGALVADYATYENGTEDKYGSIDPTLMYEVLPEPSFGQGGDIGPSPVETTGGDNTPAETTAGGNTPADTGNTPAQTTAGGNTPADTGNTPADTDSTPADTAGNTAANTTAPATTAGDVASTTAASTTGAADDAADEGGCKSAVAGSFAVIALISGAALTLCKKKED